MAKELPTTINLTSMSDFTASDEFWEVFSDYLATKYSHCPSAYGVEIKIVDIAWE